MARRKTIIGEHGTGSVRVTNGLAIAFENLLEDLEDSVGAAVARTMKQQLSEVRKAWPKPPTKTRYRNLPAETIVLLGEVRRIPARREKKVLKRTGRSAGGFRYEVKPRGDDLIFQINNVAKDYAGETYAWYVRTYDLNMDNRKGKVTRAWHHFRRRALRIIEREVLDTYNKRLPREL